MRDDRVLMADHFARGARCLRQTWARSPWRAARRRAGVRWATAAGGLVALLLAPVARADTPLGLLGTWSGPVDFFATGAPMAQDGPDADTTLADELVPVPSVNVTVADVPVGASLFAAYLYWAGSIADNNDCQDATYIDDTVLFTPPNGVSKTVLADACFCCAGAGSYDMQECRRNVAAEIGNQITGSYTVKNFGAQIGNQATDNASFSLVFVYRAPSLPARYLGLWDGFVEMYQTPAPVLMTLAPVKVYTAPGAAGPQGKLAWYTIEGDQGGTTAQFAEKVTIESKPNGALQSLTDAQNPPDNPMNHTIHGASNFIGVDIDQFDVGAALATDDTSIEMGYSAGNDKWWLVYNVVGINVYPPKFGLSSNKSWTLFDDADQNGVPSPGDTVRYDIYLENTGGAQGTATVTDTIPMGMLPGAVTAPAGSVASWVASTLTVSNVVVAAGGHEDIWVDVVIDDVPDGTILTNTALCDASPDGDVANVVAPDVVVTNDGSGSGGGSPGVGGSGGGGAGGGGGGGGAAGQGGAGGTAGGSASGTGGQTAGAGGLGGAGGRGGAEPAADVPTTSGDSGCGCRVPGPSSQGERAALAGLAVALLGVRRRARSRRETARSKLAGNR